MNRSQFAVVVAFLALAGAVAWVATRPPQTDLVLVESMIEARLEKLPKPADDSAIRAVVETVMAAREAEQAALPRSVAQLDPAQLNPMIESYLMGNPRILQRVSEALEKEIRTAETAAAKEAITRMRNAIYEDPDQIVLGNPNGDVTLVEMFDYNCGFCRSALPDLATLLAEDPNLKVILKEFPILSQGSVDAARIGVLVSQSDKDYWTFHEKLFTSRGQVTAETALAAAQSMGLNRVNLELEMGTPKVTAVIDKTYNLARELNISGTPTYIIGEELIPGAIGIDGLRTRIANMRACGKTVCGPAEPDNG